MFKFNIKYFIYTLLLFIAEVLIELFTHDAIIRPFFGDYLVVILMYCAVKSCFNFKIWPTTIFVLIFSYIIEILQYFHLVHLLGLDYSYVARILLGTYFAWMDLLMYTLGILTVIIMEKAIVMFRNKKRKQHQKFYPFI